LLNLLRWVSARTVRKKHTQTHNTNTHTHKHTNTQVKETFAPYYSWDYPHMRSVQTSNGEGEENAAKKRKL